MCRILMSIVACLHLCCCASTGDQTQVRYDLKVWQDDRVLAEPSVLVMQGRQAKVVIGAETTDAIEITIMPGGDVHASVPILEDDQVIQTVTLLIGPDGEGSCRVDHQGQDHTVKIRSRTSTIR
ncbi:MAG: hypothetical protein CMJ32_03950 [Phycisphaerae bacterium]|nr:hypothetical protein [Phycisphaerae bacterium]